MSSLARLCALRHLDLDLLGADKISGSHAETSGSHLLDSRAAVRSETLDLLTALTAV